MDYESRYNAANTLYKLWALVASPDSPDAAKISIVDRNGTELGFTYLGKAIVQLLIASSVDSSNTRLVFVFLETQDEILAATYPSELKWEPGAECILAQALEAMNAMFYCCLFWINNSDEPVPQPVHDL